MQANFCVSFLIMLLAVCTAMGCKRSDRGSPEVAPGSAATDSSGKQAGEQGSQGKTAAPSQPRLVVLVVIDQLPSWWFGPMAKRLADAGLLDGGMGRLLREGVYYPEAEYPYAATFTAVGHAALATGAPPREAGIPANQWYRRGLRDDEGKQVEKAIGAEVEEPKLMKGSETVHPEYKAIDGTAKNPARGVSSYKLLPGVEGVADALRRQRGEKARSISISLKARSAVFMLGRQPDLAVWYDEDQKAITTGTAYAEALPDWLQKLAQNKAIESRFGTEWKNWESLPGVDHKALLDGAEDNEAGQITSTDGLDDRFPHEFPPPPSRQGANPAKALLAMPYGDKLVIEAARAALNSENLGADDGAADILGLSFSSQDYAGHYWGQESWERLDMFLRLDDELGELFTELDQRLGPGNWAVVLTSDHGVTRLAERTRKDNPKVHRIREQDIKGYASKAAEKALGRNDLVAAFSAPTLYMSDAFRELAAADKDKVLDAIVQDLRKRGNEGIGYAERTDRFATGDCAGFQDLDALVCRSVIPAESGEIYVAASVDSSIIPNVPDNAPRTGTTHGSPNPDDRKVPILIHAPGSERWSKPREERETVSMLQVAPTLAVLLGIDPPAQAKAQPLP